MRRLVFWSLGFLAACGGGGAEPLVTNGEKPTTVASVARSSAPEPSASTSSAPQQAPAAPSVELGPLMPRPPVCAAKTPAKKPPPFSPKLDGKSMHVGSIIATPDGDDVEVHVSDFAYTCDELTSGFRATSRPDEVDIRLLLGPHLEPEGCLGWAIHDTGFLGTGSSSQDGGDPVGNAAIDASKGGKVRFDVTTELSSMGDHPRTATLGGTLEGSGCGPRNGASTSSPPLRGQKGAFLVVAGQKLPIAGAAIVAGKYGRSLVLGSDTVKCIEGRGSVSDQSFISSRAPVVVELDWGAQGDDATQGKLEGKWMGHGESTRTWDGGRLKASPSTPTSGAKSASIDLGGSTKMGKYTVALEGRVVATVCP